MASTSKVNLPRELSADLEMLGSVWRQNKRIQTLAFQCFDKVPDPYSYALDLIVNTGDFYKSKPGTLAHAVLLAFYQWTEKRPVSYNIPFELKNKALQTALKQKHQSLIKLVIKTYRIEEDAGYFMATIENLLAQQKFNEAFHCTLTMKLQEKFTLDQIVLPLIFQDKRELAIEYVKDYPLLKMQLATTLDSVCSDREDIATLASTLQMNDIKRSRFDPRWLQKVLWNIIKKCDIPLENCPNLRHIKGKGALKYLFFKRYIDQTISVDSWEELVADCVQDDSELQKELLVLVVSYGDSATALKMTKILNIPHELWPDTLKFYEEDNPGVVETDQNTEYWDLDTDSPLQQMDYLSLEIQPSAIHIIESIKQFVDCLTDIIENYSVVGVDAEWKPSFGIASEKLSLLQLGVSDKIFLIDFISLLPHLQDQHFDLLSNNFLSNPNILKLGYGISTDLKILMKYYRGRKKYEHSHVLDVGLFYDMLQKKYPDTIAAVKNNTMEISNEESVKGLSKLCQMVLGKPLSKCEQFSDWEKRPLRDSQILYAALDAHCLLKIYEVLYGTMHTVGLDAETAVNDFLCGKWKVQNVKKYPKTRAGRRAFKEKNQPQPSTSRAIAREPVAIKDFKVVVDNMLQGLGRYLRIYGADVVILENHDEHTDSVKIAFAEERVILSNGAPFQQIKSHVPEDMCLCIPATLDAKEQAKFVFNHFNVQLSEEDIFSRCTICNGDEYVEIPSERLMNLWLRYGYSYSVPCQNNVDVGSGLCDMYCAKMKPGVSIQMENLSDNVFKRVKEFLVCTNCGKVYWEGSHHMRLKESLSNLLLATDENDITSEEISGFECPVDPQMKRLDLTDCNEIPSSSFQKLSGDLTHTSECASLAKRSGANPSAYDDSDNFRSYTSNPNIMNFDEDLSDDECDFIVFNS